MNEDILISLDNVRFSYPGAAAEALAGVSLSIHAGEHVCILGGNGSGKSTLAQMLNALLVPSAGTVRVLGLDSAASEDAPAIRRQVAMVFQHPEDQMVTSIAADDVAFGPENLGVSAPQIAARVDNALEAVGMARLAHADPADLSGGQKQRIAIAGALAMEPRILVLDEPCAMLDAEGHRAIQGIIHSLARRGITIVHITHFMDDALKADRVIVMERGRVALEGTPEQVFQQQETAQQLGLELPFRLQLAGRLRAAGRDVPPTADTDELIRALASTCSHGQNGAPAAEHVETGVAEAHLGPGAALAFDRVSFSYASARSARKKPHFWQRRASKEVGPLAVDDLSFAVRPGTLTALVGRTGSGKSTTVELACALKAPSSGHVVVDGIGTGDLSRRRALRSRVGYVSQLPERQLFAETVFDDVAFGPRNLGLSEEEVRTRVEEGLTAVGLPVTDELLTRSPFALSGGQQRSVALAGILAMRQPILVLDEPMAGLDPAGRRTVRKLLLDLKRRGTTLLLVTHSMDDAAELADHIVALEDGRKVADGTPHEVFATAEHLPGVPAALAFARALAAAGNPEPLTALPLTLDELVCALTGEEARHGAAR